MWRGPIARWRLRFLGFGSQRRDVRFHTFSHGRRKSWQWPAAIARPLMAAVLKMGNRANDIFRVVGNGVSLGRWPGSLHYSWRRLGSAVTPKHPRVRFRDIGIFERSQVD